jgi:hypothetical protein
VREQKLSGFSLQTTLPLVREMIPSLHSLGSSPVTTAVTPPGLHESQDWMEKVNRSTNPKYKTRALLPTEALSLESQFIFAIA